MSTIESQDIIRIAKNKTRIELELVYNTESFDHAIVHMHNKTYQCNDDSLPIMLVIDSDMRDIANMREITLYRQYTLDNSHAVIVTLN